MNPFSHTGLSISDSLKSVRKSVLIYETIIDRNQGLVYDTEKDSCSMLYGCVIGNGEIIFLNGDEKIKALRLILQHHGRGEDFPISEAMVERTICFKLVVNEVTGKKH